MSTPPSLCNLSNELAINIFNRVGFKSILNLRKVCRDLRIRIDDIKPEANLLYVNIDVSDCKIRLWKTHTNVEKSGAIWCEVEYEKTVEGGRSVVRSRSRGSKKIVNGDFVELASRDLQLILKFQRKNLESISFSNRTESSNNFQQFLENLKSFLASENRLLKVDKFHIATNDQKMIITTLSLIDPQSIYSIGLFKLNGDNQPMDIAEIMEMEQWKNAKCFSSSIVTGISALHFRHFSDFNGEFQSISAEYLLDLIKIFQNSTEADQFLIYYETFEDRVQFLEKMGPSVTYDEFQWFFRMSTTDDDVLLIELEDRSITLRRRKVTSVPEDFMIQNE